MRRVLSGVGRRYSRPSRSSTITPAGRVRSLTPVPPANMSPPVLRQPLTRTTGLIVRPPISMGSPTIRSEILERDRNRCRIGDITLALQSRDLIDGPPGRGPDLGPIAHTEEQLRIAVHSYGSSQPGRSSDGDAMMLIPPTLLPIVPLPPSVRILLYSTTDSQVLRNALRGSKLWSNHAHAAFLCS